MLSSKRRRISRGVPTTMGENYGMTWDYSDYDVTKGNLNVEKLLFGFYGLKTNFEITELEENERTVHLFVSSHGELKYHPSKGLNEQDYFGIEVTKVPEGMTINRYDAAYTGLSCIVSRKRINSAFEYIKSPTRNDKAELNRIIEFRKASDSLEQELKQLQEELHDYNVELELTHKDLEDLIASYEGGFNFKEGKFENGGFVNFEKDDIFNDFVMRFEEDDIEGLDQDYVLQEIKNSDIKFEESDIEQLTENDIQTLKDDIKYYKRLIMKIYVYNRNIESVTRELKIMRIC